MLPIQRRICGAYPASIICSCMNPDRIYPGKRIDGNVNGRNGTSLNGGILVQMNFIARRNWLRIVEPHRAVIQNNEIVVQGPKGKDSPILEGRGRPTNGLERTSSIDRHPNIGSSEHVEHAIHTAINHIMGG